jgi:acyl transferase domain-containing protein/NADPH:quinone reductase-like Zn-dependent oxidoreductase/acyl carrier protein
MNSSSPSVRKISSTKLALLAREVRSDARTLNVLRSEPIAVIGLGCRFPGGAAGPAAYWGVLEKGVDAICEVPADRFNIHDYYDPDISVPGKIVTKYGGFLDHADRFDPEFFGIAPREAVSMDPQQRLFLEVAYEAFNDAGLRSADLYGSRTGIFLAIYYTDYARLQYSESNRIDAYSLSGTAHSIAVGRLSYLLNLKGPSIAVDTACSSSLVAVHLASQSLRAGESDIALAGGVSLILQPEENIPLSKWGMVSPDGRCKTFDSLANGFVRGEGCGVIVMKRLSDAIGDGDRIHAIIRGSAVNQDGRSNFLTAPNGLSQQAVIREALENAQVSPEQVSYVEAHGTGTKVGDPIEVEAVAEVVGRPRSDGKHCAIGSVKTNLGHLEAASGIAGLIKVVLCMQHERIAPHLHFKELNPFINLSNTSLTIHPEGKAWPANQGPRYAGVSSFGFGGTNAHIVLEDAPRLPEDQEAPQSGSPRSYVLPISAKTENGLSELAKSFHTFLGPEGEGRALDLGNVCYTAGAKRDHFEFRAAFMGHSHDEVLTRIGKFLASRRESDFNKDSTGKLRRTIGFVFSGDDPSWIASGKESIQEEPVFRAKLEECDALILRLSGQSLMSLIISTKQTTEVQPTTIAPALAVAKQIALATLFRSFGIIPGCVVGHGVGEVAAAHVAGVITLEQAFQIVIQHCKASGFGLCSAVTGTAQGRMPEAFPGGASQAPSIPIFSAVTGRQAERQLFGADYWGKSLCQPVFFGAAIEEMIATGCDTFLEISPKLPIGEEIRKAIERSHKNGTVLAAIKHGRETREGLLVTLGELYTRGADVRWENLYTKGRVVSLPAYPWQGKRYWFEARTPKPLSAAAGQAQECIHPLLGYRVTSPLVKGVGFESAISPTHPPFLSGHRISDRCVLPAAAMLEMAIAAGKYAAKTGELNLGVSSLSHASPLMGLEDLVFHNALQLPEGRNRVVQFSVMAETDQSATFALFSQSTQEKPYPLKWLKHSNGKILFNPGPMRRDSSIPIGLSLEEVRRNCNRRLDPEMIYQKFKEMGIDFGAAFRGIGEIWCGNGEILAHIRPPAEVQSDLNDYFFHPALLDACLQVLGAALVEFFDGHRRGTVFVPIALDRVDLFKPANGSLWSYCRVRESSPVNPEKISGDLLVFDQNGEVVAAIAGLLLKAADPGKLISSEREEGSLKDWLYRIRWLPQPMDQKGTKTSKGMPEKWVILSDRTGTGSLLKKRLEAHGRSSFLIFSGNRPNGTGQDEYEVNPAHPDELRSLISRLINKHPSATWGFVHMWNLDSKGAAASVNESLIEGQVPACGSALHVLHALSGEHETAQFVTWLVTRGAQAVEDESEAVDVMQAPIWGMGAVWLNEHPESRCVRVDLDRAGSPDDCAEAILGELVLTAHDEDQVAFRRGTRYVARLAAMEATPMTVNPADALPEPLELQVGANGIIDELALRPAIRRPPKPGEVEILVDAVGLNFRDVLNALKMLPEQGAQLGGECAGRVVSVGDDVKAFRKGDEVLAFTLGAFRSYVTVPESYVSHKPEKFSMEEAASIPVVFLTVHYAFNHLCKLSAGDRVLIHAASGGVGLAAVQVAQRVGAEIFATAGNQEKRDFLKTIGVTHVMDSRSTAFADEIMRLTGGQGVDVVLNSLAGEMIPSSLGVLKSGGSFFEIGKRGIWDERQVAEFKSEIYYFPFDLSEVAKNDPSLLKRMLSELMDDFKAGALNPVQRSIFGREEVVEAFRTMARAKHIGKIVVLFSGKAPSHIQAGPHPIRVDGTYLITGGCGGLGLKTAQWLVERGARHIALVGRRGAAPSVENSIERMKQAGAQVAVFQADVGVRQQIADVLDAVGDNMPPVRGIFHAAGVLDDGMLLNLDWPRFAKVMSPKVDGAWNLHMLTQNIALDFFVMFSSVASILGWPGQGNYAAANAFLDALAYYRTAKGCRTLSINWGPWAESGMAAEIGRSYRQRFSDRGLCIIDPEDGFAALEKMLRMPAPQIIAARLDWEKFARQFARSSIRAFFSDVIAYHPAPDRPPPAPIGKSDLLRKLAETPLAQRKELLAEHLERQALLVLGIPGGRRIDHRQPLNELGLDSLMAVELRNALSTIVGQKLHATLLFDYPTVEALVDYIFNEVLSIGSDRDVPIGNPVEEGARPDNTDDLEKLSDAEAEALLLEELKNIRKED